MRYLPLRLRETSPGPHPARLRLRRDPGLLPFRHPPRPPTARDQLPPLTEPHAGSQEIARTRRARPWVLIRPEEPQRRMRGIPGPLEKAQEE